MRLAWQILLGILAIWLATLLVPGIEIKDGASSLEGIKILLFAGIALGLINFFIKPVIKLLAFPLRALTLGLFGIIINMGIVWLVDVLFTELIIPGVKELFFASLIVWVLGLFLPKQTKNKQG